MSIPTDRAGPARKPTRFPQGERRKGFSTREMPPSEQERRWARLAAEMKPGTRVPDSARK